MRIVFLYSFAYMCMETTGQHVCNGSAPCLCSYRRLDAWLVHGLSPDTTPEHLAAKISICQLANPEANASAVCVSGGEGASLPFNLTRLDPGAIRLSIPGLQEGRKYRISVASDPNVKDGYGQGLQVGVVPFTRARGRAARRVEVVSFGRTRAFASCAPENLLADVHTLHCTPRPSSVRQRHCLDLAPQMAPHACWHVHMVISCTSHARASSTRRGCDPPRASARGAR